MESSERKCQSEHCSRKASSKRRRKLKKTGNSLVKKTPDLIYILHKAVVEGASAASANYEGAVGGHEDNLGISNDITLRTLLLAKAATPR